MSIITTEGKILRAAPNEPNVKVLSKYTFGYNSTSNTDPKGKSVFYFDNVTLKPGETFVGHIFVDWPTFEAGELAHACLVKDTKYGTVYQDIYQYFESIPDPQSSSTHHVAICRQSIPAFMQFTENDTAPNFTECRLGVEINGKWTSGYLSMQIYGIIVKED